jgi:tRNA(Met) cytidine acetyltransferase
VSPVPGPPPLSTTSLAALAALADALRRDARAHGHRRLLLLAGERAWCHAAATAASAPGGRLWIGAGRIDSRPVLAAHQARQVLGHEHATVVYDAHAGFDADAFAAVAGTLAGGGLLLLLTPPCARWPEAPDPALARLLSSPATPATAHGHFITRLSRLLRDDPAVTCWAQGQPLPPAPAASAVGTGPPRPAADGCISTDQRRAVAAVVQAAAAGLPAVLTADRGRGKSAALGLAAAELLASGERRIVVTAPRRSAADALFRHAAERLGRPSARGDLVAPGGGRLRYVAPDQLLRHPPAADLVLVDEAAAIPAPLLATLLRRDRRIAFATTVHGYEGTGRGFALRFGATLDRHAPGWRQVVLAQPVRWRDGDPLEALLFRALLLDAEPAARLEPAAAVACAEVAQAALVADEATLRALFGLLVQAHYRTTPADLRQLLDAPGVTVHLARQAGQAGQVVGVAVTVDEGRFDAATAFAVWAGRRRLRGHLVAQSLAGHAGLRAAPELALRRVQRIAVDPRLRRRGIGRRLLDCVAAGARDAGCDLVATSFGMTPDLVEFWRRVGFTPARVGLRREAASGAQALMALRPLSPPGTALVCQAAARLARQLPALLAGPLADLEPELAVPLAALAAPAEFDRPPDAEDWREAVAFAFGQRGPDSALDPLRRVTLRLRQEADAPLPEAVARALYARCVAGADWSTVAGLLGVAGRAAATERLRAGLRTALRARADADLAALIARLAPPGDPP